MGEGQASDAVLAGTWNVVVSSAHAEEQTGSVKLRFGLDRSGGELVGWAMDHGGEVNLDRVDFEPSSAALRFEQCGLPGHPKVVWACTVAGTTFDAGTIMENFQVVARFQGRKDQQTTPEQPQPQQPAQKRNQRRFPSKPVSGRRARAPLGQTEASATTPSNRESSIVATSTDSELLAAPMGHTEGSIATSPNRAPGVVTALTDSELLVNLDRDHDLAVAIFPFTLDDAEVRDLPGHEIDKLLALQLFQAVIDRELVAGVPTPLIQLQKHIADTETIIDDEFHGWLEGSHSRMAMFADVIASIRLQWAARKEQAEVEQAENVAISSVENGGLLTIYSANGKKKCDRYFTASGQTFELTWGSLPNKADKGSFWRLSTAEEAPKTMELLEVQSSIQRRSAEEWFDAVDVDGDGRLDSSQLSTLYLRARGEQLGTKQLQAAMAAMDPGGSGAVTRSDFARWWKDNCSDLDKQRELAFTVTLHQSTGQQGNLQLVVVAPNHGAKEAWVKGLAILCARKQKLYAEREEAALIEAKKRFTRAQVRDMVRTHLQREQRDPNVSDAWIDGLFGHFVVGQSKTIDAAAWDSLIGFLTRTTLLNRAQVREMVRLQLQVDGRAAKTLQTEGNEHGDVTDEWIDNLFDQFDGDGSGMIDGREWEELLLLLEKHSVWLM
jgi:hypothetical protein